MSIAGKTKPDVVVLLDAGMRRDCAGADADDKTAIVDGDVGVCVCVCVCVAKVDVSRERAVFCDSGDVCCCVEVVTEV